MSSFSKFTAEAYSPVDLTAEKQQKAAETDFKKSGHFVDTVDFKIDGQVAQQMGLSDARSREKKRVFDAEVLKYVQSIKDDAYNEAYKLGREQGIQKAKEEALTMATEDIKNSIHSLVKVSTGIDNYRKKMYDENEEEIVRFCYFLAEKILIKEVHQNKEYVAEIIKKMITADEACSVRLSPDDLKFIETHKELLSNDLNLETIKFELDESLSAGDVIVETQNGTLDGKLSTRLEKLRRTIEQMD